MAIYERIVVAGPEFVRLTSPLPRTPMDWWHCCLRWLWRPRQACERTGRISAGIEIDPRYCDVIVARWEAFTGLTAEQADD